MGNARQSIFGVELRFADPMEAVRIEPEVERRLGPEARVIDWKTLNRNLFAALSMQKLVIAMLLFFIIVVAAFNIIASLMLIVLFQSARDRNPQLMGARRSYAAAGLSGRRHVRGLRGHRLGILYGLAILRAGRALRLSARPQGVLDRALPVQIRYARSCW